MPAKTSTRSREASVASRSPPTRTRRTRSQSVERGTTSKLRGGAKLRARQGSEDSNASRASMSKKAKGKRPAQELSVLQENSEREESVPGSDEIESINEPEEDQDSESGEDSSEDGGETVEQSYNNREAAQKYKDNLRSMAKASAVQPTSAASSSRKVQPGPSNAKAQPANRQYDYTRRSPMGSSTAEIFEQWQSTETEKNKENKRPTTEKKRRLLDAHPDAEKIQFDSQEESAVPSNRKRPYEEEEQPQTSSEEDSQDEGFQSDARAPDPARRARRPSPPKRARQQMPSSRHSGQSKSRREREEAEVGRQDSEEAPAPSMVTQAKIVAKENVVRYSLADRKFQTRTPWSDHDEQTLIELIENHGCSWAHLAKIGDWEYERPNFQVQLKDKARNLKVSFLKAGVQLPLNFGQVRLGKKELEAVRKVVPDYDQDQDD